MTFTQLGIPFPLFEAPCRNTTDYVGKETCSLCGLSNVHCFHPGIGDDIVVSCSQCGVENGLRADERISVPCRSCQSIVPFPTQGGCELLVCYTCLRAGRAALNKDTVYGMIGWEQAIAGVTHGVPYLHTTDFETVAAVDDPDWVAVRLPQEMMFELLRTPTYNSIQGEVWQFCCRQPMVYLGWWGREAFIQNAPDGDGKRLFEELIDDAPELWNAVEHIGVYVFRCAICQNLVAHWDSS
jgi:uncharacterized protein CbrC (UPF0167 family)